MLKFDWLTRILAPEAEDLADTALMTEDDEVTTLRARVREDRPVCPFYGFVNVGGVIMDSGKMCNGCALTGRHSPCAMQMNGQLPEWDRCRHFNHPENQAELVRSGDARIYPAELNPRDGEPWGGISLAVWYELIIGRPYPQ